MKRKFADIAVELPVEGLFSYSIPPALKGQAECGRRALVPFGNRTVTGYIVGFRDSPGAPATKDIIDILDEEPIFDEKRLSFYRWLSSYYFAPLGTVLSLIHPGGINLRSFRFLSLTASGASHIRNKDGLSRGILEAAENGVMLSTLLKRYRFKPVYSTVERLKKEGLLSEEGRLKGGAGGKFERCVSLGAGVKMPEGLERKSPAQARIFKYLSEKGWATVAGLEKDLGASARAIKKLADSGLINITLKPALRNPLAGVVPMEANHDPNEDQERAIRDITAAFKKGGFSPFLLYGVTGSGKTLVYLRVLDEVIKAGKKAIFLVPEIALTPWPVAYLMERFPGRVALAHSGLSEGERVDEWRRILKGEADIVVGARSALFSPLKDPGLIIVDEEHETSYKQEEGVRYNGRDAALSLAKFLGVTIVLGSATPSIETFYNATESGKLTPVYLKKRVEGTFLPQMELMDMRGKKGAAISVRLKELINKTLEDKQQALLFLNRRGFSSSLICRDCGHAFPCLNCSVALTLHKKPAPGSLRCHYCDLTVELPDECPRCGGVNLVTPGAGTEKVEEEVETLFPGARVLRMDRDTTARKGAVRKIIDAVQDRRADILVGTQMVSKGHHFPGITLVGVISGDTSLNIPDFRSTERTFQLVTQAAGRAGRGTSPGTVVIQTLNPGHYCFKNAINHDYEGFYAEEIKIRQEVFYPPFVRLCNFRIEGIKEESVVSAAFALKAAGELMLRKNNNGITILGPAPALLSKLKGRYRWQMLIKGREVKDLHAFVKGLKTAFEAKKPGKVSLTVDMDPITIV